MLRRAHYLDALKHRLSAVRIRDENYGCLELGSAARVRVQSLKGVVGRQFGPVLDIDSRN